MTTQNATSGARRRVARRTAAAAAVLLLGVGAAGVSSAGAASSTLTVTSAADAGEGTLRAALEQASGDPAITQIVIEQGLGPIAPADPLSFSGSQALQITGNGAVLTGGSLDAGEDLLTLAGPSVTVRNLEVADGADDGLVVLGATQVRIQGVLAVGNAGYGVLVDDQGAETGVVVDVIASTFDGNGAEVCDTDGMRVNDVAGGSIRASIVDVTAVNNEHDGIELDEQGEGDVIASVSGSDISDNGQNPCVPFDLEDGLDIDESGVGDIVLGISGSRLTGNQEEGLDLDESDVAEQSLAGSLRVTLSGVDLSGNGAGAGQDNIDMDEAGDGDYTVSMTDVVADGGNADNYDGSEGGNGEMRVTIAGSSFSGSTDGRGLDLDEGGDGSFTIDIRDTLVDGNDNDGFEGDEGGSGDFRVTLRNSSFSVNGNRNLDLGQVAPGVGILTTRNTAVTNSTIDGFQP